MKGQYHGKFDTFPAKQLSRRMGKAATQNAKVVELTGAEAASFVGVSYHQFWNYTNGDFAPPRHPTTKKYRSDELGQWFREKITREIRIEVQNDPAKIDSAYENARKAREAADKLAQENQVRRGELVEASDIVAVWADVCSRIKARILAIPTSVAPMVAIESDIASCQDVLDERCREALEELAGMELAQDADGD